MRTTRWAGATVERLAEVVDREPPDCWDAFVELGKLSDRPSLDVLARQAQSPDPYRKRAALEAIRTRRQCTEVASEVLAAFDDENETVVREALACTALMADVLSGHRLRRRLRDPVARTRVAALNALHWRWMPEDFDVVARMTTNDEDEEVQKEACRLLAARAQAANWRRLVEMWRRSPRIHDRMRVVEMVAAHGSALDIAVLEELTADPDGHVRVAARRAIDALRGVTRQRR